MAEARTGGTSVIIDFYADWRVPCLALDRVTFTDGEVIPATAGFRKLEVALTRYESQQSICRSPLLWGQA